MISLFRELQYRELAKLNLKGLIIDLGGSRLSGYHGLIKGKHEFVVVNISVKHGYDIKADLEKKFPIGSNKYDHVLAINTIEHIYNFDNLISESFRILKPKGTFIITVPYMFKIHKSPNDYHRFTADALSRHLKEGGFKVNLVKPLGEGIFSVWCQSIQGVTSINVVNWILKLVSMALDKVVKLILPKYKLLAEDFPLGYFVIASK